MGKATYTVTVTNNSNGVSVDYETEAPMTLLVPDVAAEVVKDLVNTLRSYYTENEYDVCGWEAVPRREETGYHQPVFSRLTETFPNVCPKTDERCYPALKFSNRIFAGSINA